MAKFKPGEKVYFNGDFEGTVLRYYSEGMIEVRSKDGRGVVTISESDARPIDEKAEVDDREVGKKFYYVSVIDGPRKGLLLGPYPTHDEALKNVDRGKDLAYKADLKSAFYAFGTAGSDDELKTVFGK